VNFERNEGIVMKVQRVEPVGYGILVGPLHAPQFTRLNAARISLLCSVLQCLKRALVPDKPDYRTCSVPGLYMDGKRVNRAL
jgi:hypothetical protein